LPFIGKLALATVTVEYHFADCSVRVDECLSVSISNSVEFLYYVNHALESFWNLYNNSLTLFRFCTPILGPISIESIP